MKKKFKVGDRVRRIGRSWRSFNIGDEGIVSHVSDNGLFINLNGEEYSYDSDCFELVEEKMSLEEQIEAAKALIGKSVITRSDARIKIDSVSVVVNRGDCKSGSCAYHFEEGGNKPMVVVEGERYYIPFETVREAPPSQTVKLNNKYSAEVSKDKIKVGCQEFPIDILDKLNEARNQIRNQ